jgi:c-di-AMP phosphodiesterase-like protein
MMRRKIANMKHIIAGLIILQAAVFLVLAIFIHIDVIAAGAVLAGETIMVLLVTERYDAALEDLSSGVKNTLGSAAEEAYLTGEVGMLIYDDSYVITWMSELFEVRNLDKVGHKLLNWVPEADDLISGKTDTAHVTLDERVYEISRKEDAPVLFFKDVTELSEVTRKYNDEATVLGIASFDNYDESTEYADETDAANISAAVRVPVNEYCTAHKILTKRLGNSRYLLILNEKTFAELAADHFSILGKVRKAAQKLDVSITLSMAFARGTADLEELDDMVSNLMDLAQTRGGDQVAVQEAGEDVRYFGGSSEATEKRSRVRVRVISHALRDLIQRSSNVIICGHRTADFDCIGSAIAIAQMVKALHRKAVIIAKTGGIEEKLNAVLEANSSELANEVTFVTENEALNQLSGSTLVIMTDHHNLKQSNGSKVLENARKVVVIDHHRRSTDMGVKPVLVYIEAGASSTSELLTEMIPYVSNSTDISPLDATIMMTGMIVDTQQFRVRTGSRSYDAASALREYGADPQTANGYLKDTFDEFLEKEKVLQKSERYDHGVVLAPITEMNLSRSIMSQVADRLLGIQDVHAAFVLSKDTDGEYAISARSDGKINVQLIMEKMGGGGHLSAAAMQRTSGSIEDIRKELLKILDEYFKEEETDESDS